MNIARTASGDIDLGERSRKRAIARWHGHIPCPSFSLREKVIALGAAAGGALAMSGLVWILSVWGLVKCA